MLKHASDLGRRLRNYGLGKKQGESTDVQAGQGTGWPIYAAAAGSALALATTGAATIIYSGVKDITGGVTTINIDGAPFKLNAYAYYGFFGNYKKAFFYGNSAKASLLTVGGGVKQLASGSVISAAGPFAAGPTQRPLFGGNGFAGIRFQTASNEIHYGWVKLENVSISTEKIVSWAYESVPGQSIKAGEFVPEPSTASLTLLALGSAGVLAWRRRKPNAA